MKVVLDSLDFLDVLDSLDTLDFLGIINIMDILEILGIVDAITFIERLIYERYFEKTYKIFGYTINNVYLCTLL